MKTDSISLQPYDNIDSVLDKLEQNSAAAGAAFRFLLVWPKRGKVLEDTLDFARIRSWAVSRSYQIAILSDNEIVQKMANEQHIPVFLHREDAIDSIWRDFQDITEFPGKRPRLKRLSILQRQVQHRDASARSKVQSIIFSLLALFLVLIIAWLVLPHAQVQISSANVQTEMEIPLFTNENLTDVTINGGIPSNEEWLTLELSTTVPSTGVIHATPSLATGSVILHNICDSGRYYAKDTQVFAGDIAFNLMSDISLKADAEVEVDIEAAEPGSSGNLPPGSINLIEYPADLCFEVRQTKATSQGDDGIRIGPSPADYQNAITILAKQAKDEALQKMQDQYGTLRMVLPESVKVQEILDEKMAPGFGYAGDVLSLRQSLSISIKSVSTQQITNLVRDIISSQHLANYTNNPELSFEMIKEPQQSEDGYTWRVLAKESGHVSIDEDLMRSLTSGRTIQDAEILISNTFHLSEPPQITLWPAWLKHLPLIKANIWIKYGR